jgi:hypothetical protein
MSNTFDASARVLVQGGDCRGSPDVWGGSPAIDCNSDVECQLSSTILDASGAVAIAGECGDYGDDTECVVDPRERRHKDAPAGTPRSQDGGASGRSRN